MIYDLFLQELFHRRRKNLFLSTENNGNKSLSSWFIEHSL